MDISFKFKESCFNVRVAGVWLMGRHVLIHQRAGDDFWALPGGRVKMHETMENALLREFNEELGLGGFAVERLLWTVENFFTYEETKFHEMGFYYLLSGTEQEINKEEFPGAEGDDLIYKWVPVDELHNIPLYPEYLREGIRQLPVTPEHKVIQE